MWRGKCPVRVGSTVLVVWCRSLAWPGAFRIPRKIHQAQMLRLPKTMSSNDTSHNPKSCIVKTGPSQLGNDMSGGCKDVKIVREVRELEEPVRHG